MNLTKLGTRKSGALRLELAENDINARNEQGVRSPMSQAHVDPSEVRRFAHTLKHFNDELQTQMATLHGQLVGLSQTWRDREQQKFTEEFEQTMLAMSRFVEASNQHIPFLLRKAERAEEYLNQR